MQCRLDKEGKEFHHYDDFCQLYRAEILNLNRILDALVRNGVLPSNFIISTGSQVIYMEYNIDLCCRFCIVPASVCISIILCYQSSSAATSMSSTGGNTPHTMLEKLLGSPRKAGSPRKPGGSPQKSPEKTRSTRFNKPNGYRRTSI